MGRECITGICKNAIDPFNNPILNTCVKCERTNNASLLGYSVTGVALNSATVLTAKYYDDYQFKMQNGTLISNSSLNYEANSEFGEDIRLVRKACRPETRQLDWTKTDL